jgi:HK97 family phage major capsid protein
VTKKITELDHKQTVFRMKDIAEELDRLSKKDTLTGEDEVRWADFNDEFSQLDSHRKHIEREDDLSRIRSAMNSPFGKSESGVGASDYNDDPIGDPRSVEDLKRSRNPWDLSDIKTFGRSKALVNADIRDRALAAIEKMPFANDRVRQASTEIIEQFDDSKASLSRLCLAASSPEYIRAWSKCAAGREHMLSNEERDALERAMSLTDSAGGYLVPFQLDPTVIITANGSRNEIRQIARQVVAIGDTWNGVSSGAVSWSWDAEATEVSDDSTTFGQPSISVYKAAGFVPISIEALEDEANVTAEVARLLAFGRDVLEAAAFATGTGSGQPFGIVTALVASSPTVVVNSASTDTFASGDVYALDNALPARYRGNSSWLGNRAIYNRVRNFDTQGGAQMWERIGADVPAQLLGRSVYESEDMDGTLNTGAENYFLVYGDFSNYVIADRIGMTVEFIPHLFGTTNGRPKGQRGWYAYYRVGADSVNDGAFRILDVT